MSAAFVMAVLAWCLGVLGVLFVGVTLLPLVRTGAWAVRGWEFPRLQLAGFGAALAVSLGVLAWDLRGDAQPAWGAPGVTLPVLLSLIVIAIGWQLSHVVRYTPLWPRQVPSAGASSRPRETANRSALMFRMVCANLDTRNERYAEVAEALTALNADVLLLIEVHERWRAALSELRTLYPHHTEAIADEGLGMVLWSRRPVRNAELRYLVSKDRVSIHAEIDVGLDVWLGFVGIHPVPPGLRAGRWFERYDSRIRDAELLALAERISAAPQRPWLIAGDFNDVAWSQTTGRFRRNSGLCDPRVGRSLLNTYHARLPWLRYPLDHIYLSPGFEVGQLGRVAVPGSDHFGVLADLRLVEPEAKIQAEESDGAGEVEELIEEGRRDAASRQELTHERPG